MNTGEMADQTPDVDPIEAAAARLRLSEDPERNFRDPEYIEFGKQVVLSEKQKIRLRSYGFSWQ